MSLLAVGATVWAKIWATVGAAVGATVGRGVGDVVGLGVVTYFLPNVPLFMHLSDPNVPKLIILLKRTGRVRSSLQRLDEHRALYKKKIKWLYLNKN